MKKKNDLWPEINLETSSDTPLNILLEQAEILSNKTKGLITCDVLTNSKGKLLYHTFYLVAPSLNNYRYSLMDIVHSVMPYPTFIYINSVESDDFVKIKKVRRKTPVHKFNEMLISSIAEYELAPDSLPIPDKEVNSPEEFISEIEKIFKSENTLAVINSLVSQSLQNEKSKKLRE